MRPNRLLAFETCTLVLQQIVNSQAHNNSSRRPDSKRLRGISHSKSVQMDSRTLETFAQELISTRKVKELGEQRIKKNRLRSKGEARFD